MALRDALKNAKGRPPNLRRGNARKRCGLCRFFGDGECVKYASSVRSTELCDSFEPKETS